MRITPVLILALTTATCLGAQKSRRGCTGDPSVYVTYTPAYRDCEVDRAAELKTTNVRPDFNPAGSQLSNGRCFRAEVQFIVDSTGAPELATVRTRSSNSPDMETAVRGVVPMLRYQPALLDKAPVRQIVVYKSEFSVSVVVAPAGSPPPSRSSMRPPTGC